MYHKKKYLDLTLSGNIKCFSNTEYGKEMVNTVQPFLKKLRHTGYYNITNNVALFYHFYQVENPIGTIIISHGFGESIQKYEEMIYYFTTSGYNVFGSDHRGHGASFRHISDKYLIHILNFNDYVTDLKSLIDQIVLPATSTLPLYLYAHSMGGAIGTIFLEQYPNYFKKAVLSSPMMKINTHGLPQLFAKSISHLYCKTGHNTRYIYRQKTYIPYKKFETCSGTSKARYTFYMEQRNKNKYLQTSVGSFGWLNESLNATKQMLKKENLKKISAPILLLRADSDTLVLPKGYDSFLKHVKQVTYLHVKNTKHEIYNSPKNILEPYLNTILNFFS